MAHFTLVVVEHQPEKCPLAQATPDWAKRLASNLEDARPVGFFEQQEHKGGLIFPVSPHADLAEALADILPEHLAPELKDTEAPDSSLVAQVAADPQLLDGSNCDEVAFTRLVALAREFDAVFPHRNLRATEELGHKRTSLRDLPAYLREHAPVA